MSNSKEHSASDFHPAERFLAHESNVYQNSPDIQHSKKLKVSQMFKSHDKIFKSFMSFYNHSLVLLVAKLLYNLKCPSKRFGGNLIFSAPFQDRPLKFK